MSAFHPTDITGPLPSVCLRKVW